MAEADLALKAQLQAVETHAEVVPIGAAVGFGISVADMTRYHQASQSELLHWSVWDQLGVVGCVAPAQNAKSRR